MKATDKPQSSAQRVDAHDDRLRAAGGRKLNGIRLSPEAAQVLADIESTGESATAAINRLLIESSQKRR